MDISTQGEMPFPLERGVSLAPGYATMIGLRKVKKTIKLSTKKAQLVHLAPGLIGEMSLNALDRIL